MLNRLAEFARNGGRTSVYPCCRVCTSSIKLISARSRRAPASQYTANRAPVILAARSRSSIPSSGPKSQCAFAWKPNSGGFPQRRISTLSASVLPIGTESCGMFGTPASIARKLSSTCFTFSSSAAIRSPNPRICACFSAVSTPCFFSLLISALSELRCAFNCSTSVSAVLRSRSSSRNFVTSS